MIYQIAVFAEAHTLESVKNMYDQCRLDDLWYTTLSCIDKCGVNLVYVNNGCRSENTAITNTLDFVFNDDNDPQVLTDDNN